MHLKFEVFSCAYWRLLLRLWPIILAGFIAFPYAKNWVVVDLLSRVCYGFSIIIEFYTTYGHGNRSKKTFSFIFSRHSITYQNHSGKLSIKPLYNVKASSGPVYTRKTESRKWATKKSCLPPYSSSFIFIMSSIILRIIRPSGLSDLCKCSLVYLVLNMRRI